MGNSVVKSNMTSMGDTAIYTRKPPAERLHDDMEKYASPEALAQSLRESRQMYLEIMEHQIQMANQPDSVKSDLMKTKMTSSVKSTMTKYFQLMDSYAYGRDVANGNEGSPHATLYYQRDSIEGVIFRMFERRETMVDFHQPLRLLKNGYNSHFLGQETLKHFLEWYSFCKGNNQIYIDLLQVLQSWIPDEPLDTLPYFEFQNVNDLLSSLYGSAEYKEMWGNAKFYYYIDPNDTSRICYDVSTDYFDGKEELMNWRVKQNKEVTLNIGEVNPSLNGKVPDRNFSKKSKISFKC